MSDKTILGVFKIQHRTKDNIVTVPSIFHKTEELVFEIDNDGVVTVRPNGDD